MPDIGLLQGGPPRPRVVPPPVPSTDIVEDPPAPARAHSAVVSETARPIAVLTMIEPVGESSPPPTSEPSQASASEPPQEASGQDAPARGLPPASRAGSVPTKPAASVPPIRMRDLLWLLLALAVIVATGLGIRDPWPADEPRFASLARDMVLTGEWLFPRVGGDLYQDKPPLFFWLLAVSYTLFGAFKGWFLLPSLFAAAGVLFLIYDFGRRTVGREAGLAAAVLVCCTLQFVLAMRGAQIDPTLCFLTTLSVYAMLRHLLLGDGWRWYALAGAAAGLGIFTKGVGFLPMFLLIPYFAVRAMRWNGLARLDAGAVGWRWWLAPLAMLGAVSLWFVPMLIAAANGGPEYAAYRDEILFKQTVGRYAAAWHHVKPWYYFLLEVIPALWLPWSVLLVWLVPQFKRAFGARDARVWLPLGWVLVVVLFFSMSPGKRGIYILPALPALALASLPVLQDVIARRGVRIAGWVLACGFWLAATVTLAGVLSGSVSFEADGIEDLPVQPFLIVFLVSCTVGLAWAWTRMPLSAWPVTLGSLCIAFSFVLAPRMNGERSGSEFIRGALAQVQPAEDFALVAYKEQFLLYLDRHTWNFGHRRWQEGPQEYFDAAAWLNAAPGRVLLVPEEALMPKDRFDPTQPAIPCFKANATSVGVSSDDEWFLVRAPAESACAALGDPGRAIAYPRRVP